MVEEVFLPILHPTASIDYENLCAICHENYDTEQTHVLPECMHKFHTNCIITWFRSGHESCPYCGNNGINHLGNHYYNYKQLKMKISLIRKYVRKKDANPIVINEIEKLKILEKRALQASKDYQEFKINMNSELVNFNETLNKMRKLRSQKLAAYRKVYQKKQHIAQFPINSIIIPRIVEF